MQKIQLLYPLTAMVAWTLWVGLLLARARVRAVRGGLSPGYFLFNRGAKPPEYLLKLDQHYDNLFETPLLFCLACVVGYVDALGDGWLVGLAWAYVATRLVHGWEHLGQNRLLYRRRAFFFSYGVLVAMWGLLLIRLS